MKEAKVIFWVLSYFGFACCLDGQTYAQNPANETLDDTLFVRQIVLCKGVKNREPVDIVEGFYETDKRGICYLRVYNTKSPTHVFFHWFYEGESYSKLKVKVGLSKVWRTYSSVRLKPGLWRVEVQDIEGRLVEGIAFRVHRLEEIGIRY